MPDGDFDLVMVRVGGVQRFIAESRSTADLHAGSALMSELASAMLKAAAGFEPNTELIMPTAAGESVPNRLVVQIAAGHGPALAKCMADAANEAWARRERSVLGAEGAAAGNGRSGRPATPGFPDVQWVVAGPGTGGYPNQWKRATQALAARKRISTFAFPPVNQDRICSLTGRWVAHKPVPKGAWNVRPQEDLSLPAHVKRAFSRAAGPGFASTWSIASAPYRAAIIKEAEDDDELRLAVADLREWIATFLAECDKKDRARLGRRSAPVPGIAASSDEDLDWLRTIEGAWCRPWTWEPAALRRDYDLETLPDATYCEYIRHTASALGKAAGDRGLPPLTGYLAVIAQDADHMGSRLSGFPGDNDPVAWHQGVSAALAETGQRQREAVQAEATGADGLFACVVYAGGDDFLALAPAATALSVAETSSAVFQDVTAGRFGDDPATASTAVVYFDASWPLQSAISAAQALLDKAKGHHRPGIGITVLRGGGERSSLILPWADRSGVPMISHLHVLAKSMAGLGAGLSGRLASELERDASELATLGRDWLRRELARRCARHGGAEAADALLALGHEDANGRISVPDQAVTIARFLAAQVGTGSQQAEDDAAAHPERALAANRSGAS